MLTPNVGSLANPASFGEDAVGNQYIVSYGTGSVFRINTTLLLDGDYNADGTVDAADYIVWRKTLGSTTNLAADGNHNQMVDSGDFTVWRKNFGSTVHNLSLGEAAAVPEPVSTAYLVQLLALLWLGRSLSGAGTEL